jgi:hypothetical protein
MGGLIITNQAIKEENQKFTCLNPKCRRAFANPIVVQNLCPESTASYCACPHCLTEIKEAPKDEEKRQENIAERTEIEQVETQLIETKPAQQPFSETNSCPHHFGYLSQSSRGKEVPGECMICKKLIECMLFKFDSATPEIESSTPVVKKLKNPLKSLL